MKPNAHDVTERGKLIMLRLLVRHRRAGRSLDIQDVAFRRRVFRAARRLEERRAARGDQRPLSAMPSKILLAVASQRTYQHHGWRIVVGRNAGKWHAECALGAEPNLRLVTRGERRAAVLLAMRRMIDGRHDVER
ncbi:hypothetical protein [Azospirillum argentinense]|uniref:hypothetical protein n=1 Tax=Azospirillum argentinense TaxID=2970906 RepID=UPI0032DF39B0